MNYKKVRHVNYFAVSSVELNMHGLYVGIMSFLNYLIRVTEGEHFIVTTGAISCFFEISTPFICLRWMLFHHGMKLRVDVSDSHLHIFDLHLWSRGSPYLCHILVPMPMGHLNVSIRDRAGFLQSFAHFHLFGRSKKCEK